MDPGYLPGLERIGIMANYILLAGTFIHSYLKPREHTEWLIVSSTSYFIFAFFTIFFLMFARAAVIEPIVIPLAILWSIGFLFLIKSRVELISGKSWIIPLALLLLSIGQEMFAVATADEDSAFFLIFWYMLGLFVVFGGSVLTGKLMDRLFPALTNQHVAAMRESFGEEAPKVIKFKNGDVTKGDWTPGTCASMGIIYSVWMLLRHMLFPF